MDLETNPAEAVLLCRESEQRLARTVAGLDDAAMRAPSLLPGWTRAHVVTHLARNADGHARRIGGALAGRDVARYPGGDEQRDADIDAGARRPAADIAADLTRSQDRLVEVLAKAQHLGWPHGELRAGDSYDVRACPARRLREVEMHHVDLGLAYTPADWPAAYVSWELAMLTSTVVDRLPQEDHRRSMVAWLSGRGPVDAAWRLGDWI